MRMGNFLSVNGVITFVMATTTSRVGIDHTTVVPTNFDPEEARLLTDDGNEDRDRS